MKTNTGFTLIELMMTLAIAAIVLTLGIPSFQETMRSNRLTTQANDLVTAINLARAEAVKRRSPVSVCASSNQTTCTGAWNAGFIVVDDVDDEVLQVYGPLKGSTTVTASATRLRYTPDGFLDGGAASIQLCVETGAPGRRIEVTATGRPANVNPYPQC